MLSLVPKTRPLALGELRDKLVLLIRKIYRRERNELCFGVLDVKKSIQEISANLIILAADAKAWMLPLDFFSHLTRMATNSDIPFVYVLTEKELTEACCGKPNVTVLSIKKGVVCFSAKVQEIISAVESLANSCNM